MTLAAGARLGPYEIVAPLGAGGMGEVYRAKDTRLGREVAIKVLPAEVATDPERRKRFEQEARAVSSLSHPGIVTLFEIESAAGPDGPIEFLAMELVPGEPLNRRIPNGGLPVAAAVDLALQAAEALAAAHEAGVVHRDLKPANLVVMPSGRLKVLDFGLARLRPTTLADPEAPTVADSSLTRVGSILGTLGYLSPEQAAGERADERSDLFSLGVVLYEMLSGVSPFARDSPMRSLAAVLQEPAPPLAPPHGALPPRLGAIVARCLAKEPAARYPSAAALADDLRAVHLALEVPARSAGTIATRSPVVRFAAIALALGVGSLAVVWFRGADERWLVRVALPGIEKQLDDDKRFDAFLLAREAARRVPDDARLAKLVERFTIQASIASEPAGATVSISDYVDPHGVWQQLGTTPLAEVRVPDLALRFRLEKPGFDPIESAPVGRPGDDGRLSFEVVLTPAGQAPAGMVRVGVRTAEASFRLAEPMIIEPFWLDRLEVSNRDYQRFVDDGGYARRELWREPFVDGEKALSWEEATARFRDATGRPGPAGWELGRYPEGKADLPVGGVSWYEASAYAAWAGKSLPTFHHWYLAASPDIFSEIVQLSNFDGDGPRPVGTFAGLGPWGTLDMAGNIKEWVSTASGDARYLLGGGWSDPSYLYAEPDRALPMARDPAFGFRCARYDRPLEATVSAPVAPFARDFTREQPVDDPLFAALTSVYSYDRAAPLGARQEPRGEEGAAWRLERVSIAPVTGDERLPIRLYLPKSGRAPYSTVIFFPDSSAEAKGISEQLEHRYFEFLLRSGRAVAFPVFANTYERRRFGWTAVQRQIRRDLVITWTKELSRTIDYLQTRPDLDPKRVALYGFSLGAVYAPIFAALEPRLATTIILGGGFPTRPTLPEADPFNFAPRVRMPVLMIAGRDDFVRPLESQQRPLFERLGTPGERKRLAVLDGGHLPPKMNEIVREILDWLDQWLGPANG